MSERVDDLVEILIADGDRPGTPDIAGHGDGCEFSIVEQPEDGLPLMRLLIGRVEFGDDVSQLPPPRAHWDLRLPSPLKVPCPPAHDTVMHSIGPVGDGLGPANELSGDRWWKLRESPTNGAGPAIVAQNSGGGRIGVEQGFDSELVHGVFEFPGSRSALIEDNHRRIEFGHGTKRVFQVICLSFNRTRIHRRRRSDGIVRRRA